MPLWHAWTDRSYGRCPWPCAAILPSATVLCWPKTCRPSAWACARAGDLAARQLCPNLQTIAPDFDEVLRLSRVVRGIFCRYTNRVQPFGVDEAWLDVSGPDMSIAQGERIANHMRHAVREETGAHAERGRKR